MKINWIKIKWEAYKDDTEWIDIFDGGPNQKTFEAAWKPGNLVKMNSGRIYLIGTVNLQQGTCSCCGIEKADIVAYAVPFPELVEFMQNPEKKS